MKKEMKSKEEILAYHVDETVESIIYERDYPSDDLLFPKVLKAMQSYADQVEVNGVSIADLKTILKSDSVYTLLRYGVKSPSSSGVDGLDEGYYDLYNICCELRKPLPPQP